MKKYRGGHLSVTFIGWFTQQKIINIRDPVNLFASEKLPAKSASETAHGSPNNRKKPKLQTQNKEQSLLI